VVRVRLLGGSGGRSRPSEAVVVENFFFVKKINTNSRSDEKAQKLFWERQTRKTFCYVIPDELNRVDVGEPARLWRP
jgi:hypothetical protein